MGHCNFNIRDLIKIWKIVEYEFDMVWFDASLQDIKNKCIL